MKEDLHAKAERLRHEICYIEDRIEDLESEKEELESELDKLEAAVEAGDETSPKSKIKDIYVDNLLFGKVTSNFCKYDLMSKFPDEQEYILSLGKTA